MADRRGSVNEWSRHRHRCRPSVRRVARARPSGVARASGRSHLPPVAGLLSGARGRGHIRPRLQADGATPPVRPEPGKLRAFRYRWCSGVRRSGRGYRLRLCDEPCHPTVAELAQPWPHRRPLRIALTAYAQAVAGRLFPGVGNQHAAVGARYTGWTSQPVGGGRTANLWVPAGAEDDVGAHGIFDDRAGRFFDPYFLEPLPLTLRTILSALARTGLDRGRRFSRPILPHRTLYRTAPHRARHRAGRRRPRSPTRRRRTTPARRPASARRGRARLHGATGRWPG